MNSEPQDGAWLYRMTLADPDAFEELLDQSDYDELVETL